ncbi:unnamed protein product [Phytophthora fragariaefolia]|uniref:Unnamed protein product n=1 Tax=Phytophthora fragariaefolia TaxID=1490495 RepID=A0A9W6X517_9STRA|nr:unnamed protein product [Phytophthora fragariaefolia]
MAAEIVHRWQGFNIILVRISLGQRLADFDADLEAAAAVAASARISDAGRSYNAANYARIMWRGMPTWGWVVDEKLQCVL